MRTKPSSCVRVYAVSHGEKGAHVKTDARNYGIQREYGPLPEAPGPGVMSVEGERTWSALAHLSTYLNIFTGFLGPVVAFVIWLVYKDDSPAVARHALRSVFYQVAWLSAIFIGWAVTFALMAILVGFLLVPVMAVVTLAPFVQASYEAYLAYRDGGRRYL
jgi:uncharacterized Tic20 family protein